MKITLCWPKLLVGILLAVLITGCGGDDDAADADQTVDVTLSAHLDGRRDVVDALCNNNPDWAMCRLQQDTSFRPGTLLTRQQADDWARNFVADETGADFDELLARVSEPSSGSAFDRCVESSEGETICLRRMPLTAQRQLGCLPTSPAGVLAALSGSTTLQNMVTATEIASSDDPESSLREEATERLIMLGKKCDFLNEFRAEISEQAQFGMDGPTTPEERVERINQLAEDSRFVDIWSDSNPEDIEHLGASIRALQDSDQVRNAMPVRCRSIRVPLLRRLVTCS